MCFDICTVDIRVSIRVRGLHLVLFLFYELIDGADRAAEVKKSSEHSRTRLSSRSDLGTQVRISIHTRIHYTFHKIANILRLWSLRFAGGSSSIVDWTASVSLSLSRTLCCIFSFSAIQTLDMSRPQHPTNQPASGILPRLNDLRSIVYASTSSWKSWSGHPLLHNASPVLRNTLMLNLWKWAVRKTKEHTVFNKNYVRFWGGLG